MQVILMERVAKLGQMGDVVTVKQGYARNYLLPLKKAMRATEANIKVFETQKSHMEAQNLEAKSEADSVAKKYLEIGSDETVINLINKDDR